jgi:ADP-ribose pyrophosphatase
VLFNRKNNSLILIRQFRYPVFRALKKKNDWLYELVAGVVERGETLQGVVRREVMEEAGYKIKNLKLLTRIYPSPGGMSERIYIFYAEVAGKENAGSEALAGGGVASEHEDIRVLELPVAKVYAMLEKGKIEDAKTVIGLLYARERVGG